MNVIRFLPIMRESINALKFLNIYIQRKAFSYVSNDLYMNKWNTLYLLKKKKYYKKMTNKKKTKNNI